MWVILYPRILSNTSLTHAYIILLLYYYDKNKLNIITITSIMFTTWRNDLFGRRRRRNTRSKLKEMQNDR